MVRLTRLNHVSIVLNADLIQHIENTPDTVITLTTGQKLVVLESTEEVVDLVVRFRKSLCGIPFCTGHHPGTAEALADDEGEST